jgi:regulatory protein
MPVVTDIRAQRRRTTLYSVYIDTQFAFSLTDLQLSASGLRVGLELSQTEAEEWQRQAADDKAYDLALRFLSYRVRSSREVLDYLVGKHYGRPEAAGVVERLQQTGLVDDVAFAAAWVADRQALRPRSRRVLEQELLAKGVSREVAVQAVAAIGPEGHEAMLQELVAKKRRQTAYQDDAKLVAYLARQGYGYGEIKKALGRLDD